MCKCIFENTSRCWQAIATLRFTKQICISGFRAAMIFSSHAGGCKNLCCILSINYYGALSGFKICICSKGILQERTKLWLWFGITATQILHIVSATRFDASTPQITVLCPMHLCFSIFFSPPRRKKYFLCTDTQGQNNKHKQGEAGRCWIHFHAAYHQCGGASRWCWCKRMYVLRRYTCNRVRYFCRLHYCVVLESRE